MRKNFLFLLTIPILTGCTTQIQDMDPVIEELPEITVHNYFEVEEKMVRWEKVFDIPKENYFLYYFSPTCSHCADIKDWIIEQALLISNLYFVQASASDIFTKDPNLVIGATSVEEIAILGYPSMIEIIGKKVTQNVAGKTKIEALLNNNKFIE